MKHPQGRFDIGMSLEAPEATKNRVDRRVVDRVGVESAKSVRGEIGEGLVATHGGEREPVVGAPANHNGTAAASNPTVTKKGPRPSSGTASR